LIRQTAVRRVHQENHEEPSLFRPEDEDAEDGEENRLVNDENDDLGDRVPLSSDDDFCC